MKNCGQIGGNTSWQKRLLLLKEHIWPLKGIDAGWENQCACGSWIYSFYRKKYVCKRCGRWIRELKCQTKTICLHNKNGQIPKPGAFMKPPNEGNCYKCSYDPIKNKKCRKFYPITFNEFIVKEIIK